VFVSQMSCLSEGFGVFRATSRVLEMMWIAVWHFDFSFRSGRRSYKEWKNATNCHITSLYIQNIILLIKFAR